MLTNRITKMIAVGAVVLGAGLTTALPVSAATHHSRQVHHSFHHARTAIPQHNGGDRDADNNGGPSDGDGNV